MIKFTFCIIKEALGVDFCYGYHHTVKATWPSG